MGKIFKYLWEFKGAVLGIILLLMVQAFCDLSLPQYTSDIVDTGIQQGGISHVAMEEMRPETFRNIGLFLSEENQTVFESSYALNKEGDYERTVNDKKSLEQLDEMLECLF